MKFPLPLLLLSLSLTGMLLPPGAAAQAHSSEALAPADAHEIYLYSLTMDKIQKMSAVSKALMVLGKQHPEFNSISDEKTIDGMLHNILRYPEAVSAITGNGLTPREYVVCLMTVMQASIAVGFRKSGAMTQYPAELLEDVSKANLDFTEQHWVEIQQLTQAMSSHD